MKPTKPNQAPCKECPYRKDSAKGWLGDNSLDTYAEPITSDIEIPCHKTMSDDKQMRYCAGLASVRVNSCKSARFSTIIALSETNVKESPHRSECFNWKHEFEEHHGH